MRIDAHQHYWNIARGDYGWLTPALGAIYCDFGPPDLAPDLAKRGIDKTILVQAAPTEAETRYLLALAAETPSVAGVVGWVDFDGPDVEQHIAALAADRLLVGLRPMIHDIADDAWMLSARVDRALRAVQRHELVFDALVRPRHLGHLRTLAAHHPGLTVVVDHCAKPEIAIGKREPWAPDMAALAEVPNVVVKLSGLLTEAAPGASASELAPYVAPVLDAFGPARVLWGSDWPVLTLSASYDHWCRVTDQLLAKCRPDEQRAILGGNAARLYLGSRGRR